MNWCYDDKDGMNKLERDTFRTSERLTEIRMMLRFLGGQSFLMIVSQELVQEVDGFIRDVTLVVCDGRTGDD